jgi:hypothetical protein
VVEPGLFEVGDEESVDLQVDGVLQCLLDGGALAAGEGAVERVARAFALQHGDDRRRPAGRREPTERGVGALAATSTSASRLSV